MRALVGFALVLAACEDGIVLEVHVHPDVPSQRVELFLALDKCSDCTGLQLEGEGAPRTGNVYYRDGDPDFVAPVDSDGVARFRIEPSDKGERFKVVLAVGVDDRPVPVTTTAATVIAPLELGDGPRHIIADLELATSALPDATSAPDGSYVTIWRQQAGNKTACIAFERWKSKVVERGFIVPASDPDCDDHTNLDCEDYAFGSATKPSLDRPESLTCTGKFMVGSDQRMACMLGGELCVDGQAPGRECGPSFTCVADALCNCADADRACLSSTLASATPQPRLRCHFPVQPLGGGDFGPCPGSEKAFADLGAFGLQCSGPLEIASIDTPLGPFAPALAIDVGGHSAMVIVPAASFMSPCGFDVGWQGKIGLGGTAGIAKTVVATLPLGGMVTARRILVAFDIVFEPTVTGCMAPGIEAGCGPTPNMPTDGLEACF